MMRLAAKCRLNAGKCSIWQQGAAVLFAMLRLVQNAG
jgi:hypothetical protein